MKALMVLASALALLSCASPEYPLHDIAPDAGAMPGVREAAQQEELPGCPAKQRKSYRLADEANDPFLSFQTGARYAQLDDPTKDWTRDRQSDQSGHCPTGRKHRYFA
ncbi:MAG TPA: hypothetical protein VMF67_03130 [Rhizomicrobium sp.]|nr:hypothetical protein [Rhizomicrobium sp.]